MSRFACVYVPWFAAAAAERDERALRDRAVALLTGTPPATRVVEANGAARERGVVPGLTEAQARARCAALVTRATSQERLRAAQRALLDAALAVSPRVEDVVPGCVHVEIDGLGRLFGDERAVAARLARNAWRVTLPARAAVAGSRVTARVTAARALTRVSVVPPGADAAAIAAAPLDVLVLDEDLIAALARWGVRTLGELAALPRASLADRLGPTALEAHDAACGRDTTPFRAYTPPPFWDESLGVDWEITTLEALAAALATLLDRLWARLSPTGVAVDALTVSLDLASGARDDRTIEFACPLRDPRSMLALARTEIEARPPAGAVTRILVAARPVRTHAAQAVLGQPPAPSLRDAGAVMARLVGLVGAANVGASRLLDSHRPDSFTLMPFAPSSALADGHARGDDGADPLVLRRLRPPRRIGVAVAQGRPCAVRWSGVESASAVRVVKSAGPWRLSGEWWDERAWARDEWDLALEDGTLCRVAHEPQSDAWYLDGAYD